jgi:hypothetical protein
LKVSGASAVLARIVGQPTTADGSPPRSGPTTELETGCVRLHAPSVRARLATASEKEDAQGLHVEDLQGECRRAVTAS